jgi:hypothetical protein
VALQWMANFAEPQALRRVRAREPGCDDPFHRCSKENVFVKAGSSLF